MDVPVAAAGPWVALGAVLGVLLLLVVGTVAVRLRAGPRTAPPAAPPPVVPHDDLADFRTHPPGTPGARGPAEGDGFVPLASPMPDPTAPAAPAPGSHPGRVLAAFAVAALLLVGAAAALAVSTRSPEPTAGAARPTAAPSTSPAPPTVSSGPTGLVARLAFEGVVLEEHAVGITAAHPELELTVEDGHAVAHLRLPAVNCLAVDAPPTAGDPACRTARTEYADLGLPDLRVERDGDEVTVSGRFATYRRPPGGAEERTARSYAVSVTVVAPDDGGSDWVPAEATLLWDGRSVGTRADGPPNVLRSAG